MGGGGQLDEHVGQPRRGYGAAVIPHLSISAFIPLYCMFPCETIVNRREEP